MWFVGAIIICALMAVMGAFSVFASEELIEGERYEQVAKLGGFGLYVVAALMLVASFVKLLV